MTVTARDHWITTERGILFARKWTPADPGCDRDATILLFHDSLGCVDLWRDFPSELAAATRRTVVAYDRLGFGRSDALFSPPALTFIRDEAMIVSRLIEALEFGKIIPFGHSVGGEMAIATAARLPDRCPAVITESAQSFVEEQTLCGVRAAQARFEGPGQFERLRRYHGEKARWVLDAWIDKWLAPAFAGWCLDDDLQGVRCSTLALHGDQDEYASVQHPERIARLVQGPSRTVVFEGCGHIPHRERPKQVLAEVIQFLTAG